MYFSRQPRPSDGIMRHPSSLVLLWCLCFTHRFTNTPRVFMNYKFITNNCPMYFVCRVESPVGRCPFARRLRCVVPPQFYFPAQKKKKVSFRNQQLWSSFLVTVWGWPNSPDVMSQEAYIGLHGFAILIRLRSRHNPCINSALNEGKGGRSLVNNLSWYVNTCTWPQRTSSVANLHPKWMPSSQYPPPRVIFHIVELPDFCSRIPFF